MIVVCVGTTAVGRRTSCARSVRDQVRLAHFGALVGDVFVELEQYATRTDI